MTFLLKNVQRFPFLLNNTQDCPNPSFRLDTTLHNGIFFFSLALLLLRKFFFPRARDTELSDHWCFL